MPDLASRRERTDSDTDQSEDVPRGSDIKSDSTLNQFEKKNDERSGTVGMPLYVPPEFSPQQILNDFNQNKLNMMPMMYNSTVQPIMGPNNQTVPTFYQALV